MTLLIDEIYKFYSNPQNLADFEEWKERKYKDEDSQIESSRETCQTQSAAQ
jgi:hypothetical protein